MVGAQWSYKSKSGQFDFLYFSEERTFQNVDFRRILIKMIFRFSLSIQRHSLDELELSKPFRVPDPTTLACHSRKGSKPLPLKTLKIMEAEVA